MLSNINILLKPTPIWLYLLVLCSGALTVFVFAPFNIYPLTWLTPVILFYALSKATTKKQYFFLSWVYGIGLFGAGTFWPFYIPFISLLMFLSL